MFSGARQVFDTRNTTTAFKKDGKTTQHTHYFVTSLTTREASASHLAALSGFGSCQGIALGTTWIKCVCVTSG